MDLISLIEFILKASSVVSLAAAAGVIAVSLRQGLMRPRPVWMYALFATAITAVWRSTIAFSVAPEHFWPQEINHATFLILGIAFLILAVCSRRQRSEDT